MFRSLLICLLCLTGFAQQLPLPPHYEQLPPTAQLQPGMQSAEVAALQWALAWLGYELDRDGVYGEQTRTALEDFQRSAGLSADGLFGPGTRRIFDQQLVAAPEPAEQSVSALRKRLKAALRAGERGVTHQALAALAALDARKATDAILDQLDALLPVESSYRLTRKLLAGVEDARGIARLLSKGAPLERVFAVEVLELRAREEDDELLLDALSDRHPAVRRRTILALRSRKRLPVVYALIAHMKSRDKQPDGEQQQAAAVLDELVGVRLGLGEDYENWFDGQLDTQQRPPTGLAEPTVSFYDAPLVSPNLVFIFDTSCSMRVSKLLEPAKQELQRTIESLPDGTRFNILSFANEVRPWQEGQVKANKRSREAARAYVAQLDVEGNHTRLDRALRKALTLEGVDTVVVLTDGYPMRSQNIPDCVMLDGLEEQNRMIQARVVTLGFAEANHGLLEAMARSTGGDSRQID